MKICFVAPLANVLFASDPQGVFGGSEIRAWTLARALARLGGFDVSIVVQRRDGVAASRRDGVAIAPHDFNAVPERPGFMGRLLGVMAGGAGRHPFALPESDVVCAFGAVAFNAQLADTCHRQGRRFVLLLGSDIDVAGDLADIAAGRPLDGLAPRPEAVAALAAADLVVAQTEWQARRVETAIGRSAVVVPSPVDLDDQPAMGAGPKRSDILWIGKTDRIKRPELAMEVARLVPELHFRIVVNPSDRSAWDQLARAAPPNVTLIERFPFTQTDQIYGQALVLLNTSAFEGFPNAFLQAGKHGVPVVSAVVDPDGFLQRTGSGIVAGPEPAAGAAAIRRLANDPQEWRRASSNIRAYVERHHDSGRCAAVFARSLVELASVAQDRNRRSARA